jgi:hypothetical protein
MYHGTSSYGFTVFDAYGGKFGLFCKGSYFTDNPDVAESYTHKGGGDSKGVYAVYLNVRNPLDMDAKADLSKWKKAFDDMDLDASYLDGVVTNEDAFKALNQARKNYKEDLTQLTSEYSASLTDLKNAFEAGKADIHSKLAAAEDAYAKALKEFTTAHPEGYHVTLRDGDFETTISHQAGKAHNIKKEDTKLLSLFDLFDMFGF